MRRFFLATCFMVASLSVLSQSSPKLYRIKTGSLFDSETGTLMQKAVKAGVTIVAGADDYNVLGFPSGEMFKRTLFMYHTAGLSIPHVLQTATVNAARHLRWENRLGSIKKGYWADLVAVDPAIEKDLNVLLNVRFVMKGGVIVKQ